jgi:DNA helicase-2/ATP-dependent DNA helicase PcrA
VRAGTFHAVRARLLRKYADAIGLDRAFTIHDREDSAHLMNLVRHDLGFSRTKKRFPMKGTCLAIYSRTVNAELPLEEALGSFSVPLYPLQCGFDQGGPRSVGGA